MSRPRKPNPRDFNSPKTCGGKYCYTTRHDAEMVIEEKSILQPELKLKTYHCPICHSWHLTRQRDETP